MPYQGGQSVEQAAYGGLDAQEKRAGVDLGLPGDRINLEAWVHLREPDLVELIPRSVVTMLHHTRDHAERVVGR